MMTIFLCTISLMALCGSVVCLYLQIRLGTEQNEVLARLARNDEGHRELDDSMDRCMDMVSRVSAETAELKRKMEKVDEVMEDFAEAGRMSVKNEQAISEGINNILNYAPAIYNRSDD